MTRCGHSSFWCNLNTLFLACDIISVKIAEESPILFLALCCCAGSTIETWRGETHCFLPCFSASALLPGSPTLLANGWTGGVWDEKVGGGRRLCLDACFHNTARFLYRIGKSEGRMNATNFYFVNIQTLKSKFQC